MSIDWAAIAPAGDDGVNALPKRLIDTVDLLQVLEQAHPENGQRFMIKAVVAMVMGEGLGVRAHPRKRLFHRKLREITQGDGDVGLVIELLRGDRFFLEGADEFLDLRIVTEVFRFQTGSGKK